MFIATPLVSARVDCFLVTGPSVLPFRSRVPLGAVISSYWPLSWVSQSLFKKIVNRCFRRISLLDSSHWNVQSFIVGTQGIVPSEIQLLGRMNISSLRNRTWKRYCLGPISQWFVVKKLDKSYSCDNKKYIEKIFYWWYCS